jgi:AcrR family transcriptional regulator
MSSHSGRPATASAASTPGREPRAQRRSPGASVAGKRARLSRLTRRKNPTQVRSQKTVQRILQATRTLLRDSAGLERPSITTREVAKQARISIGSLYQYFPNVEAIVFALYADLLTHARDVLEEFSSPANLTLPREAFFAKLNAAMVSAEPDGNLMIAIHRVVKSTPSLEEADRQFAAHVAAKIAGFLRHHGSRWPTDKLERMALFVYYLDFGTWLYRSHAQPPQKEVVGWEIETFNYLFDRCFD